jgi:hypothetical protein
MDIEEKKVQIKDDYVAEILGNRAGFSFKRGEFIAINGITFKVMSYGKRGDLHLKRKNGSSN